MNRNGRRGIAAGADVTVTTTVTCFKSGALRRDTRRMRSVSLARRHSMFKSTSHLFGAFVVMMLAFASPALAGPPLICNPFDTAGGTLIAWGNGSGLEHAAPVVRRQEAPGRSGAAAEHRRAGADADGEPTPRDDLRDEGSGGGSPVADRRDGPGHDPAQRRAGLVRRRLPDRVRTSRRSTYARAARSGRKTRRGRRPTKR